MLATAADRPGEQVYYVSTSIKRAVSTVWDELIRINEDQGLGGLPNWSTHHFRFPNNAKLWVTGCENKKMANDLRGRPKVALYFVDEGQDWADDLLRYFYEQVVYPSLADVRGSVIFAGSGGPPKGFWYDIATSDPGFERFGPWTPFDNPFLPPGEAVALIAKACKDRGVDLRDASIQREFFAAFIADLKRQIFPYVEEKNGFDRGEWDLRLRRWTGGDLPGGNWQYVIASDFGTVDAAAVVVWGWSNLSPHLYLLETDKQADMGSSGQAAMVRAVAERYGAGVVATVGDPGGGGKGVITDLRQEHWLPVEGAEKAGKAAACITLRDGLRTGRVKIARQEAEFILEIQQPEWDPDGIGTVVKGHFPDRADAALYGYRKATALHHYQPPPPALTDEQKMFAEEMERQEREERRMRDLGLS
jgi:hypothetical protein